MDRANYKGVALLKTEFGNFLLAADFHNARIDVFDKDFKQVDLPDCVFFAKQLPRSWRTRRPISSPAIWTSAGQPRVSRVPDAGFTGRVEYGVRPGIRHGRAHRRCSDCIHWMGDAQPRALQLYDNERNTSHLRTCFLCKENSRRVI